MDMTYYTAIIFIEVFAAVVMLVLMSGNMVLNRKFRMLFCLEYLILIGIAVTEWLNTVMNGWPLQYRELHYFVKFLEFCLTPVLPLVVIISMENKVIKILAKVLIYGNIIMQLVSIPTGFVFYMNESNEYVRGAGYPAFVAIYSLGTIILIAEMCKISRKYQGTGNLALWVGCLFAMSGVGIQLVLPNARTSWLTVELSLGMAYNFIERLLLQNDTMTGTLNRFAYEKQLEKINYRTLIMVFDVDDFKLINDSYGHQAGDAALLTIAGAIKKVFGHDGMCYRIGGDEFCVIFKKKSTVARGTNPARLDELIESFNTIMTKLKREDPRITGVSLGYAYTDETETPQLAFQIADQNMYNNKEQHHNDAERRG